MWGLRRPRTRPAARPSGRQGTRWQSSERGAGTARSLTGSGTGPGHCLKTKTREDASEVEFTVNISADQEAFQLNQTKTADPFIRFVVETHRNTVVRFPQEREAQRRPDERRTSIFWVQMDFFICCWSTVREQGSLCVERRLLDCSPDLSGSGSCGDCLCDSNT